MSESTPNPLSGLVTNRDDATSDFDPTERIVAISGILKDAPELRANKKLTRSRFVLTLNPVTKIVRAGDRKSDPSEFTNGFPAGWDYGGWDVRHKQAIGPKERDTWVEAILPSLAAAGVDTTDGDSIYQFFLDNAGKEIHLVEQTIERQGANGPYEARKRDDVTNEVLPPKNAGELTQLENGRWPDDADFEMATATYRGLLLVPAGGVVASVEGESTPEASAGGAAEVAAALFEKHNGAEDYDAFKEAAIIDPVIATDNEVRNAILVGEFEPEAVEA